MELQTARNAAKYWLLVLIMGLLFIVLGIWVFRTPLASYIALAILFGFAFLITGILEIIYAVLNRNSREGWGWSLAGGIIDFLLGILLISRTDITMLILPFFVGFGVLFRSILSIAWSLELRRQQVPDWGGLLVVGILGLVFSFILLWNPLFAGLTVVIYTALAFIFVGISYVYLAFRLRKWNQTA